MPMKVSVLVTFHEVHVLFSLIEWRWLELGHDEGMKNMAQLYLADEDGEAEGGGTRVGCRYLPGRGFSRL